MLYITLFFFLMAITFGVGGFGGVSGLSAAPSHTFFLLSFIFLLILLAGGLWPTRRK